MIIQDAGLRFKASWAVGSGRLREYRGMELRPSIRTEASPQSSTGISEEPAWALTAHAERGGSLSHLLRGTRRARGLVG
jgi:hypothetical protein